MVEPGDPRPPEKPDGTDDVDHDAGIGFSSAASLQGRPRPAEPESRAEPVTEPPVPEPAPTRAADPTDQQPDRLEPPRPTAIPMPEPKPAWARETPPVAGRGGLGARHRERPAEVAGGLGLFAVYALILFAVPTLGVSAVIALVAVTGRPAPEGDVAASHFVYQQRTLWAGAVAALLGGILIAVGLGVFVLFLLAVWLILRGAAGVLKLKAGRAIPNPRAWLI